ncbi:hypothetical protein PAEPH01_1583 [Pancytospora epiphaga]|nr:hypothetical protein PAEPH01_1583 [Pancytospora epiphaga]
MVVNYRELNRCTLKHLYPFPNIQEQLRNLEGEKILSKIDPCQGYYQVEMDEKSKELISFVINGEQYQFRRMHLGLSNAPRTFQRGMQKILGDLAYVKFFLDDILVISRTEEEHAKHLIEVLNQIKRSKAKINVKKSIFYTKEINCLGHIINHEGIRPDLSRVE